MPSRCALPVTGGLRAWRCLGGSRLDDARRDGVEAAAPNTRRQTGPLQRRTAPRSQNKNQKHAAPSMSSASGACRVSTSGRSTRQLTKLGPASLGRLLDCACAACAHPPLTWYGALNSSRCAHSNSSSTSLPSLLLPLPPSLLLPRPHMCSAPAATTLSLDPLRHPSTAPPAPRGTLLPVL